MAPPTEQHGDMTNLEAAARNVLRAIDVEGPQPKYHREQVEHLRKHWPTLWGAIGELRRAVE